MGSGSSSLSSSSLSCEPRRISHPSFEDRMRIASSRHFEDRMRAASSSSFNSKGRGSNVPSRSSTPRSRSSVSTAVPSAPPYPNLQDNFWNEMVAEQMTGEHSVHTVERDNHLAATKKPIVFSPNYDIRLSGLEQLQSFDTTKWGKIYAYISEAGVVSRNTVTTPEEASEDDLLMVHTRSYLDELKIKSSIARITENPLLRVIPVHSTDRHVLVPLRLQTKGSMMAAELALKHGWAINLGGGFHHASGEEGGGFCVYADISICVHHVFKNCGISRVLIIDLDSHQGNGIGRDFIGDKRVYIMDLYNSSIYPQDEYAEGAIRRKAELDSKMGDSEYLRLVWDNLQEALKEFRPQLVLYIAGAGILDGDALGDLSISAQGLISRDEIVFRTAWTRDIPIAIFLGGGFQQRSSRVTADSIINLYKKNLLT